MAKVNVYNTAGGIVEEMDLSDNIFNVVANPVLLHQAIVAAEAGERGSYAHTKTRGEVSGGGRKPWKQKGTGRARHGSIRSPLWIGGGIIFGPRKERNFKLKINKKMKDKAYAMLLTDKLKDEKLIVIDKFDIKERKTKLFYEVLKKLFEKIGRELKTKILFAADDKNLKLASRNLPFLEGTTAHDVNLLQIIKNDFFILEKKALEDLEKRLLKKEN